MSSIIGVMVRRYFGHVDSLFQSRVCVRSTYDLRTSVDGRFGWGLGHYDPGSRLLSQALLDDALALTATEDMVAAFADQVVSTFPLGGPWDLSEDDVRRWAADQGFVRQGAWPTGGSLEEKPLRSRSAR